MTVQTQAAVPVFEHEVAKFLCFSLLAWIMQVHNISMENLTWEQRDEDKHNDRENTMLLKKIYDGNRGLHRLNCMQLTNDFPLYGV